MTDVRPITVLHISDMQFGRNHRFVWADQNSPDDAFDTLLSRVQKDLDLLARDKGLRPDLIALTGDLAEWGRRSEFADVSKFAQGLCESTGLPRSRVVLIPGNHDIDRSASEAYFLDCRSEEREPAKPYWPKWKHFRAFFDEFYKDLDLPPTFTEDAPWSLFVFDELKVVVAGLNSTMAESHQEADHYGHLGEKQLNWFADKLVRYRREGWLRIAAMHHNYLRASTRDDENLHDANDLERLLGDLVNCVLHGHTHDGKLQVLSFDVPIFSTGSAALKVPARPEEVPNQYQFIQIWPEKFARWTRCYAPDLKRWIGDNRATRDGSDWRQEQQLIFKDVHGTFPNEADPSPRQQGRSGLEAKFDLDRSLLGHPSEDFLSRLAEVHRVRLGDACSIQRMEAGLAGLPYLRVTEKTGFGSVLYPIAGAEFGITEETLSRFGDLHRRFREIDRGVASVLVYGGTTPPAAEVEQIANTDGFQIKSFIEFQGLIDFAPYLAVQSRRLAADTAYRPSLYVPQRANLEIGEDNRPVEDALTAIRALLGEPRCRLILVLGSFGTGKTFLLKELARRIEGEHGSLVPILVEMRALEKARSLVELLAQHLARSGFERIDLPAFKYMLEQGRITLLFDGFDELALRVASFDRAAEHLQTVVEAAAGNAKIVITSRTQHFESDQQVRTALRNRIEVVPGLRVARLQAFDEPQIQQYLTKLLGDEEKAGARLELIKDIEDLMGLSANPRMLSFIAEIDEQELRQARDQSGKVTSASLYRMILDHWIDFELQRANPPGSPAALQKDAIWKAVIELAFSLWGKTDPTVGVGELVEESGRTLQLLGETRFTPEQAAFQVGSGSLLVRDAEGRFSFIHQSVMEWLIAQRVVWLLPSEDALAALAEREISPLMADFIGSLTEDREKLVVWARSILLSDAAVQAKANVELVLNRLGVTDLLFVSLAGATLRGTDYSGRDLSDADFTGADLAEAHFVGSILRRAHLAGAHLMNADFGMADLTKADLTRANLTGASLLGAKLLGAKLDGTILRRARLVGAEITNRALTAVDHFGAALPRPTSVQPFVAPRLNPTGVAWSPDGRLLASADGSVVTVFDADTGLPVRRYEGHSGGVWGVAFSPDGSRLASASSDKTVGLWDVASGGLVRRYEGHSGGVWGVAFSPDGSRLASASDDKTVGLWDVASGGLVRRYEGHSGGVLGVAFSPDGSRFASASYDSTVGLWDVASGGLVRRYEGHSNWVLGVAFSPDGSRLASASYDNTVGLWDVASGGLVRRYEGHSGGVLGVAFSPDGSRLASASYDNTVGLWDVASGGLVRRYEGHLGGVGGVAFSPDGSRLASASSDNTVGLWDVASGGLVRRYEGHSDGVRGVAFSPDGSRLASASDDKTVGLWDVASGGLVHRYEGHSGWVSGVAFSPDGSRLASASSDNTVGLWDVASGGLVRRYGGHSDGVLGVAFSPDGSRLASASADKTVGLWDVASGGLVRRYEGHSNLVMGAAFSPDGSRLASASYDKTVELWDVASGGLVRRYEGHSGGVRGVAFSPDGNHFASASDDNTLGLWDVASGGLMRRYEGHSGWVMGVAFSPDGSLLASAAYDKTVGLWDVASGGLVRRYEGHSGWVGGVAFSPDGSRLASASLDGTVRLWDIAGSSWEGAMSAFPDGWAAFRPDGRYRVGGNVGGGFWHAINLCRFEPGELDPYLSLRLADDEPLIRPVDSSAKRGPGRPSARRAAATRRSRTSRG